MQRISPFQLSDRHTDTGSFDKEQSAVADLAAMNYDCEVSQLLVCGHFLHSKCLAKWWLGHETWCPVCGRVYWEPYDPDTETSTQTTDQDGSEFDQQSVIESLPASLCQV